MFAVVVQPEDGPAWRKAFPRRDVTIGSASDNDVVIAGAAERHARIACKDGKYILVDRDTKATWLNGKRVKNPQIVRDSDVIVIATAHVRIVPLPYVALAGEVEPRDATEARLLDELEQPGTRLVYADWLQERGDHARAEALQSADRDRVRELASAFDLPWRARVATVPIENCTWKVKCPKQWTELARTGIEGERHCAACDRTVFYCATIDEARRHAERGNCVALDITSPRWRHDLAPPFGLRRCQTCDLDCGDRATCPRCGQDVVGNYMMELGEIAEV